MPDERSRFTHPTMEAQQTACPSGATAAHHPTSARILETPSPRDPRFPHLVRVRVHALPPEWPIRPGYLFALELERCYPGRSAMWGPLEQGHPRIGAVARASTSYLQPVLGSPSRRPCLCLDIRSGQYNGGLVCGVRETWSRQ